MKMNKKERKIFLKEVKPIMKQLQKLEKKHGVFNTRYAMRTHIRQVSEEKKRTQEIRRLQKELEELNKKKL